MKKKEKNIKKANMLIRKILVPIDGSDNSKKALEYALDLAEKYSAEIKLLTVTEPVVFTSPVILTQPMFSQPPTTFYTKQFRKAHNAILENNFKLAKEKKPQIRISKQLQTGRPIDRIVTEATNENFDLIVIGSHGTSGIKKWFLGSVSNKVADQAPCPVLLIK
jgi:nucleotide-binding universal stress UspA family protein